MAFGPLRSTKFFSSGQYGFRLLILWVYSLAWIVGLVSFLFDWHESLPAYANVVVVILFVLGAPSISDLFQSYSSYVARWNKENGYAPQK